MRCVPAASWQFELGLVCGKCGGWAIRLCFCCYAPAADALLLYSCTLMGRWGGFDVFWSCVYIYYTTTELVDVDVVAWNQHKPATMNVHISIEPSSWPLCPPHTLIYTGSYMKLDKVRCYVRFRSVKKYYNSLSALLVCCLLPAAVLLWLLAFVSLAYTPSYHTTGRPYVYSTVRIDIYNVVG